MAAATDDLSWAEPDLREQLRRDPATALKAQGLNLAAGLPAEAVLDVARMYFLLWLDGRVVPRARFAIDPSDEGLLFGRGVWESTCTVNGVPWLWNLHLARMATAAADLGIDLDPARLPDAAATAAFVRSLTPMEVVVRLNATAGNGVRPGIVWMTAAPPPAPMRSVRLKTVPNPVPKGQPYLTWKTFQYATRLRVGRQAAVGGEFDTALLVDADGHLLEASHANVFVRLPAGWATPAVDGGLLPGTVRQHLLARAPVPIREQKIHVDALASAREAFLTNSNVGLVPVTRIDGREFPIGDETQRLARWLGPAA